MEFFDADAVNRLLTFPVVMDALEEAHRRPPIQIADSFMGDEDGNYFVRSAVDPGRFACTKMVTGTPRNLYEGDLPAVPGGGAVLSAAAAPVRTLLLPPDLEATADPEVLRDGLQLRQDLLPPLADHEIVLEPLPLPDAWAFASLPQPALDRWLLMFAGAGLELHGLEPELWAARRALVSPLDSPRGGLLELRPQRGGTRLMLWNDEAPLVDAEVAGVDAETLAPWLGQLAEIGRAHV